MNEKGKGSGLKEERKRDCGCYFCGIQKVILRSIGSLDDDDR